MSEKSNQREVKDKYILIFVVIIIWGMIYLPGLGTLELKGTENKRIEPALTMLSTGNYTVPYLTGKRYLAKPPLMFWLISASCYLTGERSEWAARLPSAMAILLFVMVIMLSRGSFLEFSGRFMVAVIFLTTFGIISKGRECEIEAVYTSLTGIALWLWLNYESRLSWSNWYFSLLIGIVLGLGLLAKGPLILLFFALPVGIFLFREKRATELYSAGYLLVVTVAVVLFLCWAVQVYHYLPHHNEEVTNTWYVQMMSRLNILNLDIRKWFRAIGGAFLNFLPWLLLLPFMLHNKLLEKITGRAKFRACLYGTLCAFMLVNLMPGVRARYSIPLLANYSILGGWFLYAQSERSRFFTVMEKVNYVFMLTFFIVLLLAVLIIPSGLIADVISIFFKGYAKMIMLPEVWPGILLFAAVAGIVLMFYLFVGDLCPRSKTIALCGILTGITVLSVFSLITPFTGPFEKKRKFGELVSATVPESVPLYQYCLVEGFGYQSFSYYIRHPLKYAYSDREIIDSPRGSYLLVNENLYKGLLLQKKFLLRGPIIKKQLSFKRKNYYLICFSDNHQN